MFVFYLEALTLGGLVGNVQLEPKVTTNFFVWPKF